MPHIAPKVAKALKNHVGSLNPDAVLQDLTLDEHGTSSSQPSFEHRMRAKLEKDQGVHALPDQIFQQYQDAARHGKQPDKQESFPKVSKLSTKQWP